MSTNIDRRTALRLATGALAYGAGAAAVTGTGFAISEAKGAGNTLFDQRLAAFHTANDWFIRAFERPGGCSDEVSGALCKIAGDAFTDLIDTPATTYAQITAKLTAVTVWFDGSVIENEDVRIIADEARAILTQAGR
jgi:hypothetical protein